MFRIAKRIVGKFEREGFIGAVHAARRRLRGGRIAGFSAYEAAFREAHGLEVGGPSLMFQRGQHLPIYGLAAALDNCNFSNQTVWEGHLNDGGQFRPNPNGPIMGMQYIREATDLRGIADDSYDFLLSSHTLEHTANPIKALQEWQRVVRIGGSLVIAVPHRDGTFDHKRDVTPLEHMIADYEHGTDETDMTHLDEILEKHDRSLDQFSGTFDEFKARSLKNFENRCLHHHVFNTRSFVNLLDAADLRIEFISIQMPHDIIAICKKRMGSSNTAFLSSWAPFLRYSPFRSDAI